VLLRADRRGVPIAKVADFGLSRVLGFTTTLVRRTQGDGLDCCLWQAPEVVMRQEFDHRADIYAFGIILWELLTRERPFNEYEWMTDIADNIADGVRPTVPDDAWPDWAALMQRCWAQKAKARPPFSKIVVALEQMAPNVPDS
jgi:serine/threonine protein kinase